MPDQITIELSGEGTRRSDMTVTLGEEYMELPSGFSANTTISIKVSEDANPGSYPVFVNATSMDEVSAYSAPITIRIVDPEDIPEPDELSGTGDDEGTSADVLIWVLFVVLIFVLLGLVIAFVMIDRKQREERVQIIERKRERMREARKRDQLSGGKKKRGELPSGDED
jgi:hypothetical protein